jgi:hypothetical protein
MSSGSAHLKGLRRVGFIELRGSEASDATRSGLMKALTDVAAEMPDNKASG